VGIHRLLHSSCCFLNTNTAITRQLIGTARTLKAEWWQVWGEVWVRGQRKMSQVPGAFGLLDFTMLRPVLAWRTFWKLWTFYFFNFPNFFGPRQSEANWNCGYWNPRIRRSACTFLIIFRSILLGMRNVLDKSCTKNQDTFYVQWPLFSPKIVLLWDMRKNIAEPDRPQMTIWRMRIACWIPKATDTHSEYVILIAFPLQQRLRELA